MEKPLNAIDTELKALLNRTVTVCQDSKFRQIPFMMTGTLMTEQGKYVLACNDAHCTFLPENVVEISAGEEVFNVVATIQLAPSPEREIVAYDDLEALAACARRQLRRYPLPEDDNLGR